MLLKIYSKIKFHVFILRDYFLAFQAWNLEKRTVARRRLTLQFIQGQAQLITFQRNDIWWSVFPGDVVGRAIFVEGQHELQSLDSTLKWLKENHKGWLNSKAIINVGGNIGGTCIPLTHKTGKHCIVCEPVPDTFKLLKQNVQLNNLTDFISCHQLGIASQPGYVEMAVTGDSGWNEVRAANGIQGFSKLCPVLQYIKVQMITLEELLDVEGLSMEDIGLVWSDTQGFESEVIESGKKLWLAGVPLWVEVWPKGLETHGGTQKFISLCQQYFKHLIIKESFETSCSVNIRKINFIEEVIVELISGNEFKGTDILLIP